MSVKDKRTGQRTGEVWCLWKETAKEGGLAGKSLAVRKLDQWAVWEQRIFMRKVLHWADDLTLVPLQTWEQPGRMWPWWPWHDLLSASPKLRNCFIHHSRFCLKGISEFCIFLAAACGPQSTGYTTFCKCLWFCPYIASLGLSSWKMEASGIWLTVTCYYGEGNGNPLQYSCLENPMDRGAWWATVHGFVKSRTRLSNFTFTFHFHALEKEMATHPSTLAWRIPGIEGPCGLQSMGSHRVGHDWSDLAAAAACYYGWPQDCMWFSLPPSSAIHSRFPSPSAGSCEGLYHLPVLWPRHSFQRGPEWSQPLENKLYSTQTICSYNWVRKIKKLPSGFPEFHTYFSLFSLWVRPSRNCRHYASFTGRLNQNSIAWGGDGSE